MLLLGWGCGDTLQLSCLCVYYYLFIWTFSQLCQTLQKTLFKQVTVLLMFLQTDLTSLQIRLKGSAFTKSDEMKHIALIVLLQNPHFYPFIFVLWKVSCVKEVCMFLQIYTVHWMRSHLILHWPATCLQRKKSTHDQVACCKFCDSI